MKNLKYSLNKILAVMAMIFIIISFSFSGVGYAYAADEVLTDSEETTDTDETTDGESEEIEMPYTYNFGDYRMYAVCHNSVSNSPVIQDIYSDWHYVLSYIKIYFNHDGTTYYYGTFKIPYVCTIKLEIDAAWLDYYYTELYYQGMTLSEAINSGKLSPEYYTLWYTYYCLIDFTSIISSGFGCGMPTDINSYFITPRTYENYYIGSDDNKIFDYCTYIEVGAGMIPTLLFTPLEGVEYAFSEDDYNNLTAVNPISGLYLGRLNPDPDGAVIDISETESYIISDTGVIYPGLSESNDLTDVVSNPGGDTGDNTGDTDGGDTGDNTGDTGDTGNTGDNTGDTDGGDTDEGGDTGDNSGENPTPPKDDNIDDTVLPGSGDKDSPTDGDSNKTDTPNGGDNGDNTGDTDGDNTGDNTGDTDGDNTGDNTSDTDGDNTGDNTGDTDGGDNGNNGSTAYLKWTFPNIRNILNIFNPNFWDALFSGRWSEEHTDVLFYFILLIIIILLILLIIFPGFFKFIFMLIKYLFIGLWYIISAPFRLIALIVKKIKDKKE